MLFRRLALNAHHPTHHQSDDSRNAITIPQQSLFILDLPQMQIHFHSGQQVERFRLLNALCFDEFRKPFRRRVPYRLSFKNALNVFAKNREPDCRIGSVRDILTLFLGERLEPDVIALQGGPQSALGGDVGLVQLQVETAELLLALAGQGVERPQVAQETCVMIRVGSPAVQQTAIAFQDIRFARAEGHADD